MDKIVLKRTRLQLSAKDVNIYYVKIIFPFII